MTTNTNVHSATAHPASDAVKAENSDARWDDWKRRGAVRDDTRNTRVWIVASVIGAGLATWLLITMF